MGKDGGLKIEPTNQREPTARLDQLVLLYRTSYTLGLENNQTSQTVWIQVGDRGTMISFVFMQFVFIQQSIISSSC